MENNQTEPAPVVYGSREGQPDRGAAARRTRLDQIHADFDRHRARIHYDRYLAAAYPITSGVIEGA